LGANSLEEVLSVCGIARSHFRKCRYYFLTTVFQGQSEVMGRYGTDVVSYILLGMTMTPMLRTSFAGVYSSLTMSYASRALERIMMTPTSVFTLLFSQMAGGYIASALSSLLTLLVGVTLFNVILGKGNPSSINRLSS